MLYLWLLVAISFAPMMQTPSKYSRPCSRMARQICRTLGSKTFLCDVYRRVANHRQADQERCKQLLQQNWKERLDILKRQEKRLKDIEQVAKKTGNTSMREIAQFKQKFAQDTINSMLKASVDNTSPPSISKQACEELKDRVCKDIGKNSTHCRIFNAIYRTDGVKPDRCKLLLDNWESSQKDSYLQREQAIERMRKEAANNKAQQSEIAAILKKHQESVLEFLRQD
jgi:hypothetical protein